MDKNIESYQMWWSVFTAFIIASLLGFIHLSIIVWFISFWIIFPTLMVFSAIYNWITK